MGACTGKGAKAREASVEKERRRLSVSKSEAASSQQTVDNGGKVNATAGGILDLFPLAQRKSLVTGAVSDVQQSGFEDKKTEKGGGEMLALQKLGYVCKKGLKPESPNQDDFCIFRADTTSIYGVFDGHGPYGHDISNFVQESLPRTFAQHQNFQDDPLKAFSDAFSETQRLCTQAEMQSRFDCTLSGTTATLAMQRDGSFHVAHVGDSRAVLARKGSGSELIAEPLTVDHKPTHEAERRRITEMGGQVRRLEGDIPHRVFLTGKMYPGLAMTRSIGDTVGRTAGVTSDPEVRSFKVERDWSFVLLCSDGIWEFMDSQEAVDFVGRHRPSAAQDAAEALATEAWSRWIKEEGNVVDDITVIVVWFSDE
jgi:serine/threonine protein phosphatase PrpC